MPLNPFTALRGRGEKRDALDALANAFFYGGTVSASGVRVTPETALASVAVASCIEVRAETFSTLPGGVFQKQDRKRLAITDHPVAKLLFDRPNDLMTGGELQRWTSIRKDITGNAYWRVIYRNGRPFELWPLFGSNPEIRTTNGKIAYRYQGDEITPAGTYSTKDLIHHRGPFLKNPLEASSPIDLIKDTIGLSIATEQFFGRFLNNGTHFPTYLETDSVLTGDDIKAIAASLATTQGVIGAGKTRIFDRGIKVKQNQMSLKDADLTGQMRWYLEQICRIYRVPLPLVQDWTHGTYTNSEQAGLWFAQHTITPIAVDYERTTRKLFTTGEEELYVRFNVDAILRGDYATRTAGYNTLINAGVINRNEARAFEDLDPYEGGDEYLVPLNMIAASAITPSTDNQSPAQILPETPSTNSRDALAPIIEDAINRIRLRADQDQQRGRDIETTKTWAMEQVLPPIIRALTLSGLEIDPSAIVSQALEDRAIGDINVPNYVQNNAKRGLAYYEEGKGGDGLVPATIRDAKELAAGRVSENKIRKIGPWIDRHLVDLDAPKNSNPNDPDYPGPGLVAMLLWGGGPDREGAISARDWAYRETEKLDQADQ
jgi:HK97 family phage portal protein